MYTIKKAQNQFLFPIPVTYKIQETGKINTNKDNQKNVWGPCQSALVSEFKSETNKVLAFRLFRLVP